MILIGDELGNFYYSPRIMPQRFADMKARKGYVRLRGQESRTSLNKVSILPESLQVYMRGSPQRWNSHRKYISTAQA